MTGIERLREFVKGCRLTGQKAYSNAIGDIADQIEREHACDADTIENIRLIVGGVVDEMERHVLGHEGMEDSPVARWARELREALDGRDDEVTDVATIRKDAMEAYEWMCEHGGLDVVKRRWECLSYYADPVPRVYMEKRLARLQRQIDESHAALRRRNERIGLLVSELNRANNENHEEFMRRAGDYTAFTDEVCKRLAPELRYVEGCSKDVMDAALDALDRRLMPEGMEWPPVDGKPVVIGERMRSCGIDDCKVVGIDPVNSRLILASDNIEEGKATYFTDFAEHCHRPAPKVLDADGAEVELGDDLYSVEGMLKFHVSAIDKKSGRIATEAMLALDKWADPKMYTHRAPVLAADGRPLREGETVWHVGNGVEFTVIGLPGPGEYQAVKLRLDDGAVTGLDPDQLTHERPESWERLEHDAEKTVCEYFGANYDCANCPLEPARCDEEAKKDIIRRAKKLAEKGEQQ